MKTSVEISMYPLVEQYEQPILNFIQRLRQNEKLTVNTNTMSTQIFGDYDEIMITLSAAMKATFEEEKSVVMVMKVINMDLEGWFLERTFFDIWGFSKTHFQLKKLSNELERRKRPPKSNF